VSFRQVLVCLGLSEKVSLLISSGPLGSFRLSCVLFYSMFTYREGDSVCVVAVYGKTRSAAPLMTIARFGAVPGGPLLMRDAHLLEAVRQATIT